jgi:hypothetical protein
MFKYEPSAGALDALFQRLLIERQAAEKELHKLMREAPTAGFGVYDEEEFRKEQTDHEKWMAIVDAKLMFIRSLLAPFEEEARRGREAHDKRECERMMRI